MRVCVRVCVMLVGGIGFSSILRAVEFTQRDPIFAWLEQEKLRKPQMFQSANFIIDSKSLQGASAESPRVLLTDEDELSILSFQGDPNLPGFEQLERMRWNGNRGVSQSEVKASRYFEFSEEFVDSQGMVRHRSTNYKCMQCHYSPLRPIWKDYDFWPGVLGSMDDVVVDFSKMSQAERDRFVQRTMVNSQVALQGRSADSIHEQFENEFQIYKNLKQKSESPQSAFDLRYSLLNFRGSTPAFPFTDGSRSGGYDVRPNLRTSKLLASLGAKRVYGMLKEKKACFPKYRDLLLGIISTCDRNVGEYKAFEQALGKLALSDEQHDRMGPWEGGAKTGRFDLTNQKRIKEAFALFGIEKEDLNLELNPESWNYFDGNAYISDLVGQAIQEEFFPGVSSEGGELCAELETNVEQTLKEYPDFGAPCEERFPDEEFSSTDAPEVAKMCGSCHAGGEVSEGLGVPFIPFLDPTAMSRIDPKLKEEIIRRINLPAGTFRAMPPKRGLMLREKRVLLRMIHGHDSRGQSLECPHSGTLK